ncbi:MAG: hypothetical protein IVW54_11980 [Candidatus Binataceae bacterium]|nr:hypothetical protein [Candidatus Binataceae bacterium]
MIAAIEKSALLLIRPAMAKPNASAVHEKKASERHRLRSDRNLTILRPAEAADDAAKGVAFVFGAAAIVSLST